MKLLFKAGEGNTFAVRLERIFSALLVMLVCFLITNIVRATAPNPGHNFTEAGGGAVQGDILYGSAADTLSALGKSTTASRYLSNGGTSNNPAWAQVDLTNGVTGILPIANGGTNASLTLANGGVIYSTASAFGVSAAGSSGQVLRSAGAAAPTWSTATYPATAGTANNLLQSDGTNFVSTAPPSMVAVTTRSAMATGATAATAISSLTSFNIGLFNVPQQITVNQLSYNIGAVTTAGTYKICVYTEDGATKKIDVTSSTNAAGVNNVTVSSVVLAPGNYYVAMGCATTCSNTVSLWTSTSQASINTSVPTGKRAFEGTGTMTSGTCNSTLPTVTATNSKTPVVRLDN